MVRARQARARLGGLREGVQCPGVDRQRFWRYAGGQGKTIATLVEVKLPDGITREALEQSFRDASPVYQKVPGLLRKSFIVSDKGTFGGIYLWRDEASAKAWFTQAWADRVVSIYGNAPRLEWLETPIIAASIDLANALSPARPTAAR